MENESFNSDFCDKLNAFLWGALSYEPYGLTMDGVAMPFVKRQLSRKHVNDTRRIETNAWALTNKGDIKFTLIIYLGKYSLRRYAKGSSLDDCLPPVNDTGAVKIDYERELIEIQLL